MKKKLLSIYFSLFLFFISTLFNFCLGSDSKDLVDSLENQISLLNQKFPAGTEAHLPLFKELLVQYLNTFDPKIDSIADFAYSLADRYQDNDLKLEIHRCLSRYLLLTGDYFEAINDAEKGLELSQKITPPLYTPNVFMSSIGLAYAHQEKYNESVATYLKALEYVELNFETDDEDYLEVSTYSLNIGTIFLRQNELDNALQYYQDGLNKAIALDSLFPETNKIRRVIGSLYGSIGRVHFLKASTRAEDTHNPYSSNQIDSLLDLAKINYSKSVEIFKEVNELNNLAVGLHFLGALYTEMDSLEKAEAYFTQSIEIRNEFDLKNSELVRTYIDLAKLQIAKKEIEKAFATLDLAIDLALENNIQQILATAYEEKAKLLEQNGDIEAAYATLSLYSKAREKYLETQRVENLEKQSNQFKLAQEERELKAQERQALQNKILTIAFIAFFMLIVAAIITIIVINDRLLKERNNNEKLEKEKLELEVKSKDRELKYKNKELGSVTSMLLERSRLLNKIKDELKEIESKQNVSFEEFWRKLKLEENVQRDIDKFQFFLREVSSDFFFKLSENYPDLTENEKRLCIMIKLGWSTGEIAALENSSGSAIRTRKSRLKKKLNMNSDEDMRSHFSNIVETVS